MRTTKNLLELTNFRDMNQNEFSNMVSKPNFANDFSPTKDYGQNNKKYEVGDS